MAQTENINLENQWSGSKGVTEISKATYDRKIVSLNYFFKCLPSFLLIPDLIDLDFYI